MRIIVIILLLISCKPEKSENEKLTEMKSPVTIIGISEKEGWYHLVTVKDSTGKIETFQYILGSSLSKRKIGDIIK